MDVIHRYTRKTASPRTGRLLDAVMKTGNGSSSVSGGGGGSSVPQYWELVTSSSDGNPLEESQYYLRPISGKHVVVPGDVIAFADGGEYASGLPVADFDTFGLFKAKKNGGLLFDSNEGWYVDPEFAGGGGIDEEQLEKYLTDNNYITVDYLTKQGYLTLSSPLTGYAIPEAYSPITATDTILSAIGKLERNFDNYVDLTTNQTIGGVKTFNETLLSKKDVIAFADGGEYASGLPVADQYTYGLVKVDGVTVRINASGQLEADSGGGIDFTVGTGLDLSVASVLSVKFGTTAGTVCQGNDSRLSDARRNPYYLSWTGYSSGSYDGSQAKSISIPSATSQLNNDAGFIYDANHNFTSLQNSGNSSQYLAGNGRFYTISHSEIDGLSSNYVTLSTTQTISGKKTYTNTGWYNGIGLLKAGPSSNVHILFGAGSGNVINGLTSSESIGNLYFNYQSGTAFTRVDASNNLITTGDVVAYADGGSYASGLPVADTYTYGLIKYDGTTIGKNSSGQLYVINAGSGGGGSTAWSDITGKPSGLVTSVSIKSSGNCITGASFSNGTLTLTKGTISGGGSDVSWGDQNQWTGEITIDGTTYAFIKSRAISATALYSTGTNIGNINIGGSVTTFYIPNKIGTSTVGAYDKPIYLSSGSPTACSATKGSASLPVYMSSGTITACTGSSIFSSMSVSGSTLYVTVAGKQRSVTLPSGGGSTITSVNGLSGGTIDGNVSVGGATYSGLSIRRSSSYYWNLHMRSDNTLYFAYNGTSSHKMSLSSSGALYITGSLSQNSDVRLKTVLGDVNNVLEHMLNVRVFRYYLNDDPTQTSQIGFSAQEVLQYWPDNVGNNDGYYTLNYAGMGAIAFQGVKELYTRFLPVENKVKALEIRVQNLQLRLDNAYREIFELKQQMGGAA